jgi:hypothetical protein
MLRHPAIAGAIVGGRSAFPRLTNNKTVALSDHFFLCYTTATFVKLEEENKSR